MPNIRFLLIKPSSGDLWENVHHVLLMLLAAELTGRTPIVFWGTNCLYDGVIHNNAFDMYFEPVSRYTIHDLMKKSYTFYPPLWKHDNLMSDDPDKECSAYRNTGDLMSSDANVVVSDTNLSVCQLMPWIGTGHALYGLTPMQIYRQLFRKHLRLRSDVATAVRKFRDTYFRKAEPVLAVHMPGDFATGIFPQINAFVRLNLSYHTNLHLGRSDKFEVDETIDRHQIVRMLDAAKAQDPYKAYHPQIREMLKRNAVKKVFLITDREDILDEFIDEYGDMLIYGDHDRTPAHTGRPDRIENFFNNRRKGMGILADTYAAVQCAFFIGYGCSELSHAVTRLKDWPETNLKLMYWMFGKLYNFTYEFIKTGRDAPEEADGRYRLFVKRTGNSLRRIARVFR